jgi:hypothetical protein
MVKHSARVILMRLTSCFLTRLLLVGLALTFVSGPTFAQVLDITTIAGNGTLGTTGSGGAATSAELTNPASVALDASANVYIAGSTNVLDKVTSSTGILTTLSASGSQVAVDQSGNIYLGEGGACTVEKIAVGSGAVSTVAGNGTCADINSPGEGQGGPATSAELWPVTGVAVDKSGNLFIATTFVVKLDRSDSSVQSVIWKVTTASGIITEAIQDGATNSISSGGIAVDQSGNVYFADPTPTVNSDIPSGGAGLWKISTSGALTDLVSDNSGFSGDGGPASSAEIASVNETGGGMGIAVDSAGNIYIADTSNNRIRKITVATGIITTVAGDGTAGFAGDDGVATSAELNAPNGVAVGSGGTIYIADTGNQRVRAVGPLPTSTAVSCSPNPFTFGTGNDTTCTATVTGGPTPTGTLTWTVNGATLTSDSLSDGTAEVTALTSDNAGSYTIAVAYGGDATHLSSSGSAIVTIEKDTPTISASCSPNPVRFDTDTTCTTVVGDGATGTVTSSANFFATTSTLSGGSASFTGLVSVAPQTLTGTLTYNGDANHNAVSTTVSLMVTDDSQTITFTAPASPVTFGASAVTLSASATSGLAVSFSVSSGPCSVAGTTLSYTAPGICVVAANQAGNADFTAAPAVTHSITINQESQTIIFAAPTSPVTLGVGPITLSAAGGASGNPVTFSIVSGPGTLSGNMLTITGDGTVVIAVNQAGNVDFAAAAQVTQSVVVSGAFPTVSQLSASSSAINFGSPDTLTSLVNTGGHAPTGSVTFMSNGTSIGSGTVSTATTTNVLTFSNQFGQGNWHLDGGQGASAPTLTLDNQSDPFGGSAASTLAIPAIPAGENSWIENDTVTPAAGSTYTMSVWLKANTNSTVVLEMTEGNGNDDVNAAVNVTTSWQRFSLTSGVFDGTAELLWRVLGNSPSSATTVFIYGAQLEQASSVGPYVATGATSASGSGGLATLTTSGLSVGTDSIVATFNGDANDQSSTSSPVSVMVTDDSQTITFGALPDQVVGVAPFVVSASASSGLAVSFSSLTPSVCTVAGATVSVIGAGTCTIQATQGGNVDFGPAPPVSRSFAVTKGTPTMLLASTINPSIYGQTVTITVTMSSTGSTPTGSVTVMDGATNLGTFPLTVLGATSTATITSSTLVAGTHTFSVVYSGDSNFN